MDSANLTNRGLVERARRVTAAENYDIGTRFSAMIQSGEGAWLTDVEGNRYVDLTASSGTIILGHRNQAVAPDGAPWWGCRMVCGCSLRTQQGA
ncbi:hypothetical protein ACQSSU_31255 [Micromonospora echinospora]